MRYFLFIAILFLFSCKSSTFQKNKVVAIIDSSKTKIGDTIVVKLKNFTKNNYYFPIDFVNKGRYYDLPKINSNYYPEFSLKNKEGKEVGKEISVDLFSDEDQISHKNDYFKDFNAITLLKSNAEIEIKVVFDDIQYTINNDSYYKYLIPSGKTVIWAIFHFNKEAIESEINFETQNKLKEMGYTCFDGKITTNKIELIR